MIKRHLVKEAYVKVGKNVFTDEVEFVGKVIEEYQLLDVEDAMRQTPSFMVPFESQIARKHSYIALLEIAGNLVISENAIYKNRNVITVADGLLEWLKMNNNG